MDFYVQSTSNIFDCCRLQYMHFQMKKFRVKPSKELIRKFIRRSLWRIKCYYEFAPASAYSYGCRWAHCVVILRLNLKLIMA